MTDNMKAAVFEGKNRIAIEERPVPDCGPSDAIVKVTLTTICGTDVHIWREEYPVEQGRIVGHEPVGVIHQLGEAVGVTRLVSAFWWERSLLVAPAFTASRTTSLSAEDMKMSGE